ncbi:MAG: hypothetical protein GTN69_12335 [Armatimonadetes bacterium]|nr:hypothetical protein [Armatimonadota bacterium]
MSAKESAATDQVKWGVSLIAKQDDAPTAALAAGQAAADSDTASPWIGSETISPVVEPADLRFYYRNAPSLRPNVDAMAVNVHGYGWQPEGTIDFDAEDLRDQIAVALYLERYAKWEDGGERGNKPEFPDPDSDEISETMKDWQRQRIIEKAQMELFFKNVCVETSFDQLRLQGGTDMEMGGQGAWEVIRKNGKPRRFIHVDPETIRYEKKTTVVTTDAWRWSSPTTYRKEKVQRRFRLIQQRNGGGIATRYFREYGDDRTISSSSGEEYESVEKLKAKEGKDAQPANELLVFKIYFPNTPVGVPRYIAAGAEIKGQFYAANHNVDYLQNSAVPRLLMLVNDGVVGKKSEAMLKKFFAAAKGKSENRMAIIQATKPRERLGAGPGGPLKIEVVDLSKSQRADYMFEKYDRRADEKVGQQFRIPKQYRGDTQDINRATSEAALRSTEEMVFEPERKRFDWVMNHLILPELGIRFWRFRSRGPTTHDTETVGKLLEILGKLGVMVPAEMRPIAERLLDIELRRMAGDWQQLPMSLIMQGFKPKTPGQAESEEPEDGPAEGEAEQDDEGVELENPPDLAAPQQDVLKEAAAALEQLLRDKGVSEVQLAKFRDSARSDQAAVEAIHKDTDPDV